MMLFRLTIRVDKPEPLKCVKLYFNMIFSYVPTTVHVEVVKLINLTNSKLLKSQ